MLVLETYVIHVTKLCNMKCLYCYEENKTSIYELDALLNLAKDIGNYATHKFSVEFLGGEPMLAIDKIQKLIEFFEENFPYKVHEYIITTNGTIIDNTLISLMRKYENIYYAVSLDGTKYMNQLRITKDEQNSYDIAIKNIKELLEIFGPERIPVHMVTHPYNIAYLNDGIKCLYDIGIRNIGVGIIESTILIGKEFTQRYIKEMDILSNDIIANQYPGLIINELFHLKPRADQRTYLKNDKQEIIVETYGRLEKDITTTDKYNVCVPESRIGLLIEDIREVVFCNHQYKMEKINDTNSKQN